MPVSKVRTQTMDAGFSRIHANPLQYQYVYAKF
jgi:hypothetical protein